MHSSPRRAPRRMWTLSQTAVPAPTSTPSARRAVGLTKFVIRPSSPRAGDQGETPRLSPEVRPGGDRRDRRPAAGLEGPVGGGDDLDGGEGVGQGDARADLAPHRPGEILDLRPEGLHLVVARAEGGPVGAPGP